VQQPSNSTLMHHFPEAPQISVTSIFSFPESQICLRADCRPEQLALPNRSIFSSLLLTPGTRPYARCHDILLSCRGFHNHHSVTTRDTACCVSTAQCDSDLRANRLDDGWKHSISQSRIMPNVSFRGGSLTYMTGQR
jgi:hypothetical protein